MTKPTDTDHPTESPVGFAANPAAMSDPLNLVRARAAIDEASVKTASTSLVEYRSSGNCLVIANGSDADAIDQALQCVAAMSDLSSWILCPGNTAEQPRPPRELTEQGVVIFHRQLLKLQGHLGQFDVQVAALGENPSAEHLGVIATTETGLFDLVLDLGGTATIDVQLPPFGYIHADNPDAVENACAQLSEMVGEFQKPKYFDYQQTLCAHSRSQLNGCSNCLDVCATGAISSITDGIEVDPFLCQGCGHCATVCPSGAMTYAYPSPATAIDSSRDLLNSESQAVLGIFLYPVTDEEEAGDAGDTVDALLPDHVLSIAAEETGAFGIDYWASMIAAGVRKICVLQHASDDAQSTVAGPGDLALVEQASMLNQILHALGLPENMIEILPSLNDTVLAGLTEKYQCESADHPLAGIPAASFSLHNDKRATLRAAIDHLRDHLPDNAVKHIDLPDGSPFGRLSIDNQGCTLCMACVSTCPAGALLDGQSVPQLRFIEANCLQCGLCSEACPENVLDREPRYLFDSVDARQAQILNEEEPFNCIVCHKPFATRKMIDNMSGKLSEHWMFQESKALRRLKMCEDCRVKDIFTESESGIDVHQKPKQPS